MSIIHTLGISYTVSGNNIVNALVNQTGDEEVDIDVAVAPSTTNAEYDQTLTVAALKSVVLYSDQALTIKTNSSSAPQDTINLVAGQAIVWQPAGGFSAPFAGNVTKFFLTNASGTLTANFKMRALLQQ